jgi:molybdopterin synthase sulfur carrier subunit
MKILYFGSIKDALNTGEESLPIQGETTVGELMNRHITPRLGALAALPVTFAVNSEFASADATITDSDVLALLPPFSGG